MVLNPRTWLLQIKNKLITWNLECIVETALEIEEACFTFYVAELYAT